MQLFCAMEVTITQSTIIMIDIDGVICPCLPSDKEMRLTRDQWMTLKAHTDCDPISVATLHHLVEMNIPFRFVTGRRGESRAVTEAMFQRAGLAHLCDRIIYYPDDLPWATIPYVQWKKDTARLLLSQHRAVIVVDDSHLIIDDLKKDAHPAIRPMHFALPYISTEFCRF